MPIIAGLFIVVLAICFVVGQAIRIAKLKARLRQQEWREAYQGHGTPPAPDEPFSGRKEG